MYSVEESRKEKDCKQNIKNAVKTQSFHFDIVIKVHDNYIF